MCILYTVQYIKMEIGGCKREIWFLIINRVIGDLNCTAGKGSLDFEGCKREIGTCIREIGVCKRKI